MIIETKRLLLREMVEDDFDGLYAVFSDKESMAYYPSPFDQEKVHAWITWNKNNYRDFGYGLWSLIEKDSQNIIGDCGLTNQIVSGRNEIDIGYHVNKHYCNNGYATEAAIATRNFAFSELKRDKVISLVRPENTPSCRVAEKTGMLVEKEIVKFGYTHYVFSMARKSV